MRRLFFFPAAAAIVAIAVGFVFPACSNQGEGERCDSLDDNNGNDDCAPGLICYKKASLKGGNAATDTCCPSDQSKATTAVCALSPSPPGGDSSTPPETDAEAVDGAPDAPATSDGGPDANVPDTNAPDVASSDAAEGG